MDETDQLGTPSTSTIVEALDKNKDATEEVKKVADDLLVVQAVLKEEIAQDNTSTGVVDRAVEQAGELEKRLTKTAELLEEVNESLEQAAQGSEGGSDGGSDRSPPAQNAPRH
jgi:phosphosulfolactate phosphohydrolase-like enzyme